MSMPDHYESCAICRFMRALAFSAIGAGVTGFPARWFGLEQENVILVAFFGALVAVIWANRERRPEED